MDRVFKARRYFTVPDGTDVSPFLNATDSMQTDLPWGSLGDVSIAAGRILARSLSWIHMHPVVTQITYLVAGELKIRMRDRGAIQPYDLSLKARQAAVTRPGTLFQLRNEGDRAADLLYIVSPSYLFEMDAGKVVYDDAEMVAKSWEELNAIRWTDPGESARNEALVARAAASQRLKTARTGRGSA